MPEYTYHPDLRPYARMKFPLSSRLPMPCTQMLLYPVLDARMETESYQKFTDTPMCNSRDMAKYFAMYAPGPSAAPREWLSPAESASVQGLPRAYIETAEYDCLRDEGRRMPRGSRTRAWYASITQ